MRIAFFGGSFDPPHRGHIAIAQAAADRLALHQVLVAPVGNQPLKRGLSTAGYEDRLAMVRIACRADSRLMASDLDAPKPDGAFNYTYDTLAALQQRLQRDTPEAQLFCLLGADSFHTLAHWHRATDLVLLCDFIVAARPGYDLEALQSCLPDCVRIAGERRRAGVVEVALHSAEDGRKSTLHLLLDLEEDVSATALRGALAGGDAASAASMLPEGVAGYIQTHGLYEEAGLST